MLRELSSMLIFNLLQLVDFLSHSENLVNLSHRYKSCVGTRRKLAENNVRPFASHKMSEALSDLSIGSVL